MLISVQCGSHVRFLDTDNDGHCFGLWFMGCEAQRRDWLRFGACPMYGVSIYLYAPECDVSFTLDLCRRHRCAHDRAFAHCFRAHCHTVEIGKLAAEVTRQPPSSLLSTSSPRPANTPDEQAGSLKSPTTTFTTYTARTTTSIRDVLLGRQHA